jgi:hypothetical protein
VSRSRSSAKVNRRGAGATGIGTHVRFPDMSWRPWSAMLIVTAVTGLWAHVAFAQQQVVPLPTVHVSTKTIMFDNKQALLVSSISVGNLEKDSLLVSCDRCRRYPTKIRETRPSSTIKSYSGVSWIILEGRDIQIEVTHSGQFGRFLLLGASPKQTLVFKSSGCLSTSRRRHVPCPGDTNQPKRGSAVSGGAPASGSPPMPPMTKITSEPSTVQTTLPVAFTYSSSIANSTFQCALDGAVWSPCPVGGTSYSDLIEGHHVFSVRAVAPNGTTDPAPPSFTWTQDMPPVTTITSGPSGTVATGNVKFEFSSNKQGSSFQCDLDGGQWAPCSGESQSYSNLGEGSHAFSVRAVDNLGVPSPSVASQSWTQVSRYGITSYNRIEPGAPHNGVFEYAYQQFTAQSNTITSLAVTVGNTNLPTGSVGYDVLIKLCTNQPGPGGSCNTIGQVSPQVVNFGASKGDIGDVGVSIGSTYWVVYYPPQPYGNGWITYWWAGGSFITESEQLQVSVQGYNQ